MESEYNNNWLVEFTYLLRCHGLPYIIKEVLFFIMIVIIRYTDSADAKILSSLTFMASICIDSWLINIKCIKGTSGTKDVIQFIYMIVILIATAFLSLYQFRVIEISNIIVHMIICLGLVNPIIEIAYNIPKEVKNNQQNLGGEKC